MRLVQWHMVQMHWDLCFFQAANDLFNLKNARRIVQKLPPFVQTVGLFVNESEENVQKILATVPLTLLQFHGDESPTFCQQFHRPYLKAVRVQSTDDMLHAFTRYPDARAILFDAYVDGEYGGTGHCLIGKCCLKNGWALDFVGWIESR